MLIRLQEKDIKDSITDKFNPTFYRSVDTQDMLNDLSKSMLKIQLGYFVRYYEIFFTNPKLIRGKSGHKRAWICDAMRRFDEYHDRRFNNSQLKLLISAIIQRYEHNKKMRIHDRLWHTDDNHLSR